MKKIIETNANNNTALIARLALGITVLPHGAQKLFGMFGGYGFTGTMGFLTTQAGLPYIIALLVILIEFFGALFIIFGLLTRVAAFGVIALFTGVVLTNHIKNGFFMNWTGGQGGEGIEYFILLFGLAIILLIAGGGKASIDSVLPARTVKGEERHRLQTSRVPLGSA
jgi:putative oxidoreductase